SLPGKASGATDTATGAGVGTPFRFCVVIVNGFCRLASSCDAKEADSCRDRYPACTGWLPLCVSPLMSVTSAYTMYVNTGSVCGSICLSGRVVNVTSNEPSACVCTMPLAISICGDCGCPQR